LTIKVNQIDKRYEYLEDKHEYIDFIARSFPQVNLLEQIDREKEAEAREIVIKSKFNGKIVINLIPNLKDRELGKFIVDFKNSFDDFEKFILENSPQTIEKCILDFYNNPRSI
jgi:hypothetical protein